VSQRERAAGRLGFARPDGFVDHHEFLLLPPGYPPDRAAHEINHDGYLLIVYRDGSTCGCLRRCGLLLPAQKLRI
jgi:hypothetical protein